MFLFCFVFFFFQAEDGIRDLVRSRGLGDVYKRQSRGTPHQRLALEGKCSKPSIRHHLVLNLFDLHTLCLLYTSDAADDLLCVDLGGRRIIKKKNSTVQTLNKSISQRN